ncbi:MAG: NADH-quinone oxidoreductase subunit J, partial [Pseudomonadota bacterium]|nr:NADH-quinone oxidoreductase subunit J [Pseudomonadota bacterium]
MLDVSLLVFYAFATLLIGSATMVILSISPVRGALFLVLAFFASSVLWLLIDAEFLALALIFVYVGAVMTLFLFVVMMLNLDTLPSREGFVRYLPFGVIVMAMFVALMIYAISPVHFAASAEGFT